MNRSTRFFAVLLSTLLLACVPVSTHAQDSAASPKWLSATAEKLPRWRGFNLLEKFTLGGGRKPFLEEDFRLISKLGFNFVRLPMDYRLWIKDNDWTQFDESTLREIDQAVEWGAKYGIHVCICFHRAPGYTVARPPEKTSLWTDPETQRVCALHWATFARRYRGIPNERLSFNLMNEPAKIDAEVYAGVARKLVAAIRTEDPNRLVISDGIEWGRIPVLQLRDLHIAQATRGYTPGELTHYKASWVHGENYPPPAWPRTVGPNGILLSPKKKEGSYPLVIDGPFNTATQLRLRVGRVSVAALLQVEADGAKIFEKRFQCGAGEGEWKTAVFVEQYKIYQNLYDCDYTTTIPAGTKQVQVRVAEGDWLSVDELGLKSAAHGASEVTLRMAHQFGKKPDPFRYAPGEPGGPLLGLVTRDKAWLWSECIVPWKEAEAQGIGVMVGEWGSFNKTPHDLVLRWAEDCLTNWKQAGWGWAMWNFRGSFGILDSQRADVQYEDFEGHKLDRKLLDLIQRY
jgi:aryl-phospho-beta-D-glucosidase BglC (GH1 family)